ncbi:MAG: STAS domain-containing protein [Deltaproteobacteria bacterium]|nr:MAG: STAS domain-containing protein [Deltaproteobacteria bacterium]
MNRPSPVPILQIRGTLIAALQGELSDRVAERFQQDVLARIERTGARGLMLEISSLDIVDTYVARALADTAQMARLMGTRTVIVGMRPEVAATLVQMGYQLDGIEAALNVDHGLELLERLFAEET